MQEGIPAGRLRCCKEDLLFNQVLEGNCRPIGPECLSQQLDVEAAKDGNAAQKRLRGWLEYALGGTGHDGYLLATGRQLAGGLREACRKLGRDPQSDRGVISNEGIKALAR